jgi:hypothetical protein
MRRIFGMRSRTPAPSLVLPRRFTGAGRAATAAATMNAELAGWMDQARFARAIDLDAATAMAGLDAMLAEALPTAHMRGLGPTGLPSILSRSRRHTMTKSSAPRPARR